MLRKFGKRRVIAVLSIVAALALGAAAYAYFTAGGSGTGSATVGSVSAGDITISATATNPLYPGGSTDVPITIKNNATEKISVGTVSLTKVDADKTGCDASAFTMPDVAVNQVINAGATATVHGSLAMADSGNQNACQGAGLTLTFTSTAGS